MAAQIPKLIVEPLRCRAQHDASALRAGMNRRNFSRTSGVVIDLCKTHGVWMQAGELGQIVRFIESGGLERSRGFDKEEAVHRNKMKVKPMPPLEPQGRRRQRDFLDVLFEALGSGL